MKTINKNELVELIKSFPTRPYTEKPILIYCHYHSGPDMFIELIWHRQYGASSDIIPLDKPWYDSSECKFFVANMIHFDQEFAEWCVKWQREKKKPAIILMEKSQSWFDEQGKATLSGCGEIKTLSLAEQVGNEMFTYIENNFELYDYIVVEELVGHIPPARLLFLKEEEIQELAQNYGVK